MEKNKYLYKNIKIKIIGIGGGGGSIVKEIRTSLPNYSFINFVVANTDNQALNSIGHGIKKFLFGEKVTHGLGCGMDDVLGQQIAESNKDKISKEIDSVDLIILISSLGGGTGSGASPVFAQVARSKNKLVLGVFTLPFKFEKEQRSRIAQRALDQLLAECNAVFIIPNDNIFKVVDSNISLKKAFSLINNNLARILSHFLNMVYRPGIINIDFADFKTILEGREKLIYLNSVKASGPNRSQDVVRKITYNPLAKYNLFIQDKKINSKQKIDRILFNIEGGSDLKMSEVNEISQGITSLHPNAKIIFGVSRSKKREDKDINVTLFAISKVGLKSKNKGEKETKEKKKKSLSKKSASTKKSRKSAKRIKRKKIKAKTSFISKKPVRRNAVEVKKEEKKAERELLEEEERLDIPAFLRQKGKGN